MGSTPTTPIENINKESAHSPLDKLNPCTNPRPCGDFLFPWNSTALEKRNSEKPNSEKPNSGIAKSGIAKSGKQQSIAKTPGGFSDR